MSAYAHMLPDVNPRVALVVGAAQSFAFGLPLLLVPGVLLALSGIATTETTAAIARGAGATVVGVGVIDWTMRRLTGDALVALLRGNLAIQVLSLGANASEILAGHLPPLAASATLLHATLSVMFGLALRRQAVAPS